MKLSDKVVVVTGAFGSLGAAVAEAAVAAGAIVFAVDRVAGTPPKGAEAWPTSSCSFLAIGPRRLPAPSPR